MLIFLLLSVVASRLLDQNMMIILAPLTLNLHEICNHRFEVGMKYQAVAQALFCGEPLPTNPLKKLLQQHSLIHVFVVSGGHFLFLERGLTFFRIPSWLTGIILIGYNLMTGLQPPGTRAVLHWLWTSVVQRKNIFIPNHLKIFMSGLLTLIFFPQWVDSASFLLSWTAALALEISSLTFKSLPPLQKNFLRLWIIHSVLYPWQWIWGNAHYLGVLSNLIVVPLIMGLLFPLSALAAIFPSLAFLFDEFMDGLYFLLTQSADLFPLTFTRSFNLGGFWIYLLALHGFWHILYVHFHKPQISSETGNK